MEWWNKGLFHLKLHMDVAPAALSSLRMHILYLTLLFLTSFTGIRLLVFRTANAMGSLLIILWVLRPLYSLRCHMVNSFTAKFGL